MRGIQPAFASANQNAPVPLAAVGPRLIAIGGGKGGVGKTFVTTNVALTLARMGHRVVAVDADLDGANLHTCLGVPSPEVSLADFVAGRMSEPEKLLVQTREPNLQIIAGTHSNLNQPQPGQTRRVELLRGLRRLAADFVLIDLGAGSQPAALDYFLVADEGLLVMRPEPTSVENAYSFLRAAFYRRLRLAARGHGVRELVDQAMDQRNERGIRTPYDLMREIEAVDPVEGRRFIQTMRAFSPRVVVNEARTAADIKLGFAVVSVCEKFFGFKADYLGYVNYQDEARESVAARKPLCDYMAESEAATYLSRISNKLAEGRVNESTRSGMPR
ncbi:MAG: P-loop NTPase [Myxococcota bacterium]|nr:P-loop NTPase [Myxococcota bacterium]